VFLSKEIAYTVITASKYGGAVRRSVAMLLKPRVLTTEGKKFVTPPEETIPVAQIIRR